MRELGQQLERSGGGCPKSSPAQSIRDEGIGSWQPAARDGTADWRHERRRAVHLPGLLLMKAIDSSGSAYQYRRLLWVVTGFLIHMVQPNIKKQSCLLCGLVQ